MIVIAVSGVCNLKSSFCVHYHPPPPPPPPHNTQWLCPFHVVVGPGDIQFNNCRQLYPVATP